MTPGAGVIPPGEVAAAIEVTAGHAAPLDFRTRLLIRDASIALRQHWGHERFSDWLRGSAVGDRISVILEEDLGRIGFPSFTDRIMEPTRPDVILLFFRDLGNAIRRPTRMIIGGSGPLILDGKLSRMTEDIDVVDEVPELLRKDHELLETLASRYALRLAHFQSHYLPTDWASRLRSVGVFGDLEILAINVYDILVSKVFSRREKDRDDLVQLLGKIDGNILRERVAAAKSLLNDLASREAASKNWYVLFGEALPE